jgi:hypothetical protein
MEESKLRREFIDEALEALDNFLRTGQYVSFEDMVAWADALETNPLQPLPRIRIFEHTKAFKN